MPQPLLILPLLGVAAMAVTMLLLWAVATRTRNAGYVDAGWAAGLAALALLYALLGDGLPLRRAALACIVGFWGTRLAIYLLRDRIIGKPEEGRYKTLRAGWGSHATQNFLVFFQAQGLLDVILATPFLLICLNAQPDLTAVELAGAGLWVLAVLGESLADWQLARFKADARNRGKTCRRGLWRYSRHPNYFFEWLLWCGYALMATPAPHGWLGWISPLIMLFLILKVTGIPPTEAQALKSRGDDYRAYQRTTSAFVPWFPSKEPSACGS